VVGCGELVGVKDYKELVCIIGEKELEEKESEFSKDSVEGFFCW
jgi:hypothetical protein